MEFYLNDIVYISEKYKNYGFYNNKKCIICGKFQDTYSGEFIYNLKRTGYHQPYKNFGSEVLISEKDYLRMEKIKRLIDEI